MSFKDLNIGADSGIEFVLYYVMMMFYTMLLLIMLYLFYTMLCTDV
jgi:hypothetical protein